MHTLKVRTKYTFGDRVCWKDSCGRRATSGTVVGIVVTRHRFEDRYEIAYEIEYDDDPYVHFDHRESDLAPLAPPAVSRRGKAAGGPRPYL
jgi:hypothetical protein